MDAVPASIRKMQGAATKLGIDDIRTKGPSGQFSLSRPIFKEHAKAKRTATAALFLKSAGGAYSPPRGNFHMPCEWVAA
jgi:hypothetical protein